MAVGVVFPAHWTYESEAILAEWRKEEGDTVEFGEVLYVMETEVVTYEVESIAEGTVLKLMVDEGDTVPERALIAIIGEEGEDYGWITEVRQRQGPE